MENNLHTYTFCREDWELIMFALRDAAVADFDQAVEVGLESVYGATVYDRGAHLQALADDIDFKLPE